MPTRGLNLERANLHNYAYRLDLGTVTGRALRIWGANWVPFTLLAYALNAPVFGLAWLLLQPDTSALAAGFANLVLRLLAGVANLVLAGAVTYGTNAVSGLFGHFSRERPGTGEILSVGLACAVPVIGTALLAELAIGLGLCALIVPGIILTCALFVAIPVAVIERPGALNALSRSAELTTDNRWVVLGLAIVIWLVTGLPGLLVTGGWALTQGQALSPFTGWLVTALLLPLTPFDGVVRAVCYHDLRVGREGAAVADLVRVFD